MTRKLEPHERKVLPRPAAENYVKNCPSGHHPLVKFVLEELEAQIRSDPALRTEHIAERAGVSRTAIHAWSTGASPRLATLDAVLGALGYELTIKERS